MLGCSNPDTNPDTNSDANSDADPNADGDANTNGDSYADCNTDASGRNLHADADADGSNPGQPCCVRCGNARTGIGYGRCGRRFDSRASELDGRFGHQRERDDTGLPGRDTRTGDGDVHPAKCVAGGRLHVEGIGPRQFDPDPCSVPGPRIGGRAGRDPIGRIAVVDANSDGRRAGRAY